ncbi:monovalent cation/H+ antiporter subunit A [Chrysiogenes arsenatis]|uniref:monovalent cation/H+ antiporter subunit A n=1 Tax=Chrysiogenes arsenatis TaxID=309797 RepID=UPI0003FBBAF8|nr:monovalent cation/H+ antiporter subunit A [Chrysiogenes arsenatis]
MTTLPLIPLLPLLGAIIPAFFQNRNANALSAGAIAATSLLLLLGQAPVVFQGAMPIASWSWIPAIGLNFAFRVSGFGFMFAFLILFIGLLIVLYARYYLSASDPMGRFYCYLLFFMGSMLGIVLSENLLLLMMFWELTSISSFLLIGFWSYRTDAREGARMALVITGGGGLAMLAGFLVLGNIVGSFELSDILASKELIQSHPHYLMMLILVLLGAFTKSAQFPFQFWLPHAMAAPTPVSAYLHSATMVKAGVFLLALLFPVLAGTPEWFFIVTPVGLITLMFAAHMALFKDDLKGLLAYSTVSHLGLITLLFGLGSPLAAFTAVFHILNHASFKAGLFMLAGIIDHETGTRDMKKLAGLWKYMPLTGTLTMIGCASMAGVPLFNGFLSKEMFLAETLMPNFFGSLSWIVPLGATLAAVFAVAYSIRMVHDVFFNGVAHDLPKKPHEPPHGMRLPAEILMVVCIAVGIFPAALAGPMVNVAAGSILGADLPDYHIAIWHGLNMALLLSVVALVGGALLYWQKAKAFDAHAWFITRCDGKNNFEVIIANIIRAARAVTATLENGSLQRYLALFVGAAIVLGFSPFLGDSAPFLGDVPMTSVDLATLVMAAILAICAVATVVFHRQRIVALIMLSAVGLIVSLAFVRFSAPDLALTQLSVEVVSIILLLKALHYLPRTTPVESSSTRRWRDIVLSLVAGGGITALMMAFLTRPYDTIAGFFLENSVPGGGGTNVVNVILVDFRGFDTMGEITVLAMAALGIYALLHGMRISGPEQDDAGREWSKDRFPMILATLTRPILPLALLFSVYIFLRGHNEPGGGFIAGLITACVLILQYIASGSDWTRARLKFDNHVIMAWGLMIAAFTGLASWIFGHPFLTSTFTYLTWPIVGKFEVASAIAFDLGVYLTVIGCIMVVLVKLGAIGRANPAGMEGGR